MGPYFLSPDRDAEKPNGDSTFDRYLSRQTPPIEPQGGELQRKAQALSYNEREARMRAYAEGTDYYADECFNQHFGQPGGATYHFPRKEPR